MTLGIPELLIIAVVVALLIGTYRLGYNSGYRKALEKALNKRESIDNAGRSGRTRHIELED